MLQPSLTLDEEPQNECTHIKTFGVGGDVIIKQPHGVEHRKTIRSFRVCI